jgi:hypothetical protein
MRLSPLRGDHGANTFACLSLQRMPAQVWQRIRDVHASDEGQHDSARSDEAIHACADSGNEVMGVFCPECGVHIYHAPNSAPDVLVLKPGTLDDTSWLQPGSFIQMNSAQGWVLVPDGVKAFEGQT